MDTNKHNDAGNFALIRTANLTHIVNEQRIVDDVTMEVEAGDTIAIVGPSGAGKSSLLRLINRLDEPTGGTVYVEGADYRTMAPGDLRRQIGMVMQAANLFPGTVADNIRYGPALRDIQLTDTDVDSLLERVELAGYAGRSVDKLSGGEAQRVSLARTLANQPQVLLLDEPTSALDDSTKYEVEKVVLDVIRDKSLTCLIVTHDTEQARRFAHSILLMEGGRIVRAGSPEEVLDAG